MGEAEEPSRLIGTRDDGAGGAAPAPARAGPAARALIALVILYRASLGPFLGGHCRFRPTCSEYAIDALTRRGAIRGAVLVVRRLLRCHPFGGGGYDPVP
jgi:putative membrane protein insertion efficiency factor